MAAFMCLTVCLRVSSELPLPAHIARYRPREGENRCDS